MNETLKLGLILFLITAISAVVLGVSNDITSVKIAKAEKMANDQARKEVLEDAEDFEPLDESEFNRIVSDNPDIIEIYEGYSDNNLVGYTFKTEISGFGGDLEVMTGISIEGVITGMKVLNHSETPGLGANCKNPEFQNQFKDKPVDNELIVVKEETSNDDEIQALTSATITSNAVTAGVNMAREVFNNQFKE
jgi:electron transport complex protein RnfG